MWNRSMENQSDSHWLRRHHPTIININIVAPWHCKKHVKSREDCQTFLVTYGVSAKVFKGSVSVPKPPTLPPWLYMINCFFSWLLARFNSIGHLKVTVVILSLRLEGIYIYPPTPALLPKRGFFYFPYYMANFLEGLPFNRCTGRIYHFLGFPVVLQAGVCTADFSISSTSL